MKIDKQQIKDQCLAHIDGKIAIINQALNETQASANSDTKSSAGDKHETSRAMAHLENERLAKQLSNLVTLKNSLQNIKAEVSNTSATLGSFIVTENGNFFISVGLGKVKNPEGDFYAIAINSPVGQNLVGKTIGDSFAFSNAENKVLAVY